MKPATVIFSSLILAGFFLTDVYPVCVECGVNMYPQNCFPCNQVCNGPASICALECGCESDQCKCLPGYYLPMYNSTYCIPENQCIALL